MEKKTFTVFKEASLYAKQLAQKTGSVTLLRPNGGGWEVFIERPSLAHIQAIRQSFRLLPEQELMEKWNNRGALDEWVVDIIWEILREKIKPTDGHSVKVCRSCGQVGG